MNEHNVFILYNRHWSALERLSDDQFGRLTRAVFRYVPGEEQKVDDDIAALFEYIRIDLDADEEKATAEEEIVEQPKPRRGNPQFKKGQPNPYQLKKVADASKHYNSPLFAIIKTGNYENYSGNYENRKNDDISNNILNNINNNLINNNISKREKNKREKVPVLPEREQPSNKKPNNNRQMRTTRKNNQQLDLSAVSPEYREVIDEWLAYKRERHQAYKQIGFNLCYKRLLQLSCQSPDKAKAIVEQSIANNWAGLFELKNQNNYERQETYEERRKRESEQRELEFKQAVERIMRTGYEKPDLTAIW